MITLLVLSIFFSQFAILCLTLPRTVEIPCLKTCYVFCESAAFLLAWHRKIMITPCHWTQFFGQPVSIKQSHRILLDQQTD